MVHGRLILEKSKTVADGCERRYHSGARIAENLSDKSLLPGLIEYVCGFVFGICYLRYHSIMP